MTIALSSFAGVGSQFFDDNGNVLSGGLVYTYAAGTTTPLTTYNDSAGLVPHPNPVVLDAAGRIPSGGVMWVTAELDYDYIVKTFLGVTVATYQDINNPGGALTTAVADIYASFVATTGSDLVKYGIRTLTQIFQDIFNARDYLAVGDGTTYDTFAFQDAIEAAELKGAALFIPPTAAGYLTERIDIVTGGIKIYGHHTKIIHAYNTRIPDIGNSATGTKAFPVFMIYRDADYTEITGFKFTSHSSITTMMGIIASDWLSYIAHIVAHNADNVWIHHNYFAGVQPRAIFFHGGNFPKIHNNKFDNQGFILHVGHTQNGNFYDAGAADADPWFSPQSPIITGNHIDAYVGVAGFPAIFLSGAVNITLKDNKLTRMNATGYGIYIYANDLGLTDINGTPNVRMGGEVSGNTIEGTFDAGMRLYGVAQSNSGVDHVLALDIHSNIIRGTGDGFNTDKVNESWIHHNTVSVTGSPILLAGNYNKTKITDNWLESTSLGNNATVCWNGSTFVMTNGEISRNIIRAAGTNIRIFYLTSCTINNSKFEGNKYIFEAAGASPIPVLISGITGTFDYLDNRYVIDAAAMVNRPIDEFSGSTSKILYRGNKLVSSTVQIGRTEISCADLDFIGNTHPGMWSKTAATVVNVIGNKIVGSSSATDRLVTIVDAVWANVSNNYIQSPVATTKSLVLFERCALSRLTHNRMIGNTTQPLTLVADSGALKYWGNEQTNNGAGGVGYTVSGTATAAAETGT